MRTLRVAGIALVAVASTFIGCAGSGGGSGGGGNPCACKPPAMATVHLSTNVQPILDRSCALSGCHTGAVPAQGQDLSAGHTVSSSVCVKSTEIPRLYRIKPGKPDDSYLVQKIEGTPGIAGLQEPPGCPGTALNGAQCPSVEDITVIRQWITEGALNN